MFTIKFINFFNGENSAEDVVCTPHYRVYSHPDGYKTVMIYKDLTETDGVEFIVSSDEASKSIQDGKFYHNVCYIENLSGKTIAHF